MIRIFFNLVCAALENKQFMNGYELTIRILEGEYVDHPPFQASRAVIFQIGPHLRRGPLSFLAEKNAHRLISTPPSSAHLETQCQFTKCSGMKLAIFSYNQKSLFLVREAFLKKKNDFFLRENKSQGGRGLTDFIKPYFISK